MFELFEKTAADCSRQITQAYSTSFSMGIKTLDRRFRAPIYAIYAMVRYADEIVDTFQGYDKKYLLQKFREDTFEAIESRISLNPVLYSFQKAVHKYKIPATLIQAFFKSMEADLYETSHDRKSYEEYIYGSAEVVGLMCLKVFAEGDVELFEQLRLPARALGAAFQKVNFLRDMNSDLIERGRVYFPGVNFQSFGENAKRQIEKEVLQDFDAAYQGIIKLPLGAREGVLLAYKYYRKLFRNIQLASAEKLKKSRIRVPDLEKLALMFYTLAGRQLNQRSYGW